MKSYYFFRLLQIKSNSVCTTDLETVGTEQFGKARKNSFYHELKRKER